MRLFIAVDLDEPVKEALSEIQKGLLHSFGHAVRPVAMEQFHLTLKFLGNSGDDELELLKIGLTELARKHAPLEIEVTGFGFFPPRGDPRVIWTGLKDPESFLQKLWSACENMCADIGFERERHGFSPHITLARVKDHLEARRLTSYLERLPEISFTQTIDRFTLYLSELGQKGATHTVIEKYPLSQA